MFLAFFFLEVPAVGISALARVWVPAIRCPLSSRSHGSEQSTIYHRNKDFTEQGKSDTLLLRRHGY